MRYLSVAEIAKKWNMSERSVRNYMNYDHGALKGIITKMLSGDKVSVNVSRFSNLVKSIILVPLLNHLVSLSSY